MQKNKSPDIEKFIKMKSELKKWGFGLIGYGALHIVLHSVLDPVGGVILIIVGICNFLIPHRSLFIVNGIAIIISALFNLIAMKTGSGVIIIILIIQFVWGIFEIRKFKLYDEVK